MENLELKDLNTRTIEIHRPQQKGSEMEATLMKIIGEWVRKGLSAALGGLLLKLVDSGWLTQGGIEQWLAATSTILAFVALCAWTRWIQPWVKRLFVK